MTTDGSGHPRFRGPGMQFKTPWHGRKPFIAPMPFFERFSLAHQALYRSLAGTGLPGAASFWIGTTLFVRNLPAGTEVIASFGDVTLPLQGWLLTLTSTMFVVSAGDGAAQIPVTDTGVPTSSPDTVTPALVIPLLLAVDSVAQEIRMYVKTPSTSIILPFTNPYMTPGIGRTTIGGLYDGALVAEDVGINGLVGGNAAPTTPQVTQWFADIKTGLTTPAIPGITTARWVANDYITPDQFQVPGPTPIVDDVGAVPMTLVNPASTDVVITNYGATFLY